MVQTTEKVPTEKVPAIFASLNAVHKLIAATGLAKDRENKQQGFKFRGIDDVYNLVSGWLAANNVIVLPKHDGRVYTERKSGSGNPLHNTVVHSSFVFTSTIDGSSVTVATYGEGQDSGDKSTNKAMSGAAKYAFIQLFSIPVVGNEDGDFESQELDGARAPREQTRAPAKATKAAVKAGTVETPRKEVEPETVADAAERLISDPALRERLVSKVLESQSVMALDQIPDVQVQDVIKAMEQYVKAQADKKKPSRKAS